jgi:hypothetical protein
VSFIKTTVPLRERQTFFLDRLATEVRATSGAKLTRADIIRALVDAFEQSGLEASAVDSEAGLANLVLERLGGRPRRAE